MKFDRENMGNRIYMARQNKGLKQLDICSSLNISQPRYSRIESGKSDIFASELYGLSQLLDVSVNYLLGCYDDLTDQESFELEQYRKILINKRK